MKDTTPSCRTDGSSHPHRRAKTSGEDVLNRAAQLYRSMGDAARLRLLELLIQGEWCVTEIVEAVGEKFSTVSQRLRVLRDAGLVVRRRQGTHLFYALADRHVVDLIQNSLAHAAELERPPNGRSRKGAQT